MMDRFPGMDVTSLEFVSKIADHLFLLKGPNRSKFPFSNGFLLTGDKTVLIDAGIGKERIRDLDRVKRIDSLIISHSHPDHILAWHYLKDRELIIPSETPKAVHDLRLLGQRFVKHPEGARRWSWYAEKKLGIRSMGYPDERFEDGKILDFGTVRLRAIHTPGHLDDHYCFFELNSKTLLTTDIDFTGFGPWYGNPEGDIHEFKLSIEKIRSIGFETLCSSHKDPIPKNAADHAFKQYLSAFDRQRQVIYDHCDPPRSLDQLLEISPFYRNRFVDNLLQRVFEEQMIQKNLDILLEDGRLIRNGDDYRQVVS